MYKYPLFELNFDYQESEAIINTINSRWISTGPKTEEFENLFAKMFSVKHAVATSNCTVALHLALQIVGVKRGDEVICPSLTFVATCNAIRYLNAIPVFADIEGVDNPTISTTDIEKKITSKTKAIIVMHYAGFACDMNSIQILAEKYQLKIIEDACHAPLSEYHNQKLGAIGDVGCFSFFSNKNISTGEGGMIVTNNKDYYDHARLLRSHGMTSMSYQRSVGHSTEYDVVDFGYNYRMDDIRSSLGIVQLNKLKSDLEVREKLRSHYISELYNCEKIVIPFLNKSHFSSNYIFPIYLKGYTEIKRNYVRQILSGFGIQTSVHYPPVHKFTVYKEFTSYLPETEKYFCGTITLPMHSRLSTDDVIYISTRLKEILS